MSTKGFSWRLTGRSKKFVFTKTWERKHRWCWSPKHTNRNTEQNKNKLFTSLIEINHGKQLLLKKYFLTISRETGKLTCTRHYDFFGFRSLFFGHAPLSELLPQKVACMVRMFAVVVYRSAPSQICSISSFYWNTALKSPHYQTSLHLASYIVWEAWSHIVSTNGASLVAGWAARRI